MEQYKVTGMHCAACSARVEKVVSNVPGVTACTVSLLTNTMGVEGDAPADAIIKAVRRAGYGAEKQGSKSGEKKTEKPENTEIQSLRRRLLISLCFLLPLMYVSMGHMMWALPLPGFFTGNHVAVGLLQLLLAGMILAVNRTFFINGYKGAVHAAPNMDTLVALGAGISFLWSVYILFHMTGEAMGGDDAAAMQDRMRLTFESAGMILTLITVGKLLEAYAKGRTTDALRSMASLSPDTAVRIRDGKEETVPTDRLRIGDLFVLRPGARIPADGTVIEGESAVDESALTGESIPVDKAKGDSVSAGTINQSGYLRCRADRVGEDTALSRILQMVRDAAATKAPIAKLADKVSGIFVPIVLLIAAITFFVWLLAGASASYAIARGIAVLVISCPCALGLATPVAIMVGSGVGAKNGILFKTAVSLEETGKTQILALDKTGTVTEGKPKVTDVLPVEASADTLLLAAAALEAKSEHPLAAAVRIYAEGQGIKAPSVSNFIALPGHGLSGVWENEEIFGGNLSFIREKVSVPALAAETAEKMAKEGKTPLLFGKGNCLLGIIAVADVIKADSRDAIEKLQSLGIRTVMLTGDNMYTAQAVGAQAGIQEVLAGVLPDGKEEAILKLQKEGKVAMVGDGINDAPALTRADIGIAIGAGTDVAVDAADVVLTGLSLTDAVTAIRLSRATLRNIRQNLFWAFIYNLIGIPLAAGAFVPLFGWELSPMFGAAAMSLSSFSVVTNALRLNLFRSYRG